MKRVEEKKKTDKGQEAKSKKKITWRQFFRLLIKAKIPWVHYLLSFILLLGVGTVVALLPEVEGRIAAGEIFDTNLVVRFILFSLVIIFSQVVSAYGLWVNTTFDRRMQKFTWRNFLQLPQRSYEAMQPSGLISRVTDDAGLASEIVSQVLSFIASLYGMVALVVVLFRANVTLALITLPVMVLSVVSYTVLRERGYSLGYQTQDAMAKMTGYLSERLRHIKYIKAMVQEDKEYLYGTDATTYKFEVDMKSVRYQALIRVVSEVSNILLMGFILIGGAVMLHKGEMDTATIIQFYIIAMELPTTIQATLFELMAVRKLQGSLEVVAGLGDLPREDRGKGQEPASLQDKISFEGVSFFYEEGGRKILNELDLDFYKGKTTAIVGPSGSGKTTILKLLERFYEPAEGRICYDGQPAGDFDLTLWRQKFGFIVQNSPLLEGTIRENMLYGARRDFSEEEFLNLAKKLKIYDFVQDLEEGFDSRIQTGCYNLSGGQRQRIAIARALFAEPEIMILDEAMSGLDSLTMREIGEELKDLLRGKTVIMVAHQLKTVCEADRIIVLSHEGVEARGSHDSLCAGGSDYYRLACEYQELLPARS